MTGPADEGEPWPPESDEGLAFPSPGHYPEEFEPEPRETAGTPKSKVDATSPKASSVKSDKSSIIDRSVLVNKIVEGLRGDAFLLARDLGLETLARPGGLERLIEVIRNHVFSSSLGGGVRSFFAQDRSMEDHCRDSLQRACYRTLNVDDVGGPCWLSLTPQ